jgi:CHAT domain-containing protein
VALAGCNARGQSPAGEDDGILTSEEIATSDFSSVDWIVLSACESGVGDLEPGEGVYGLRRSLAIAGAKTAIMSLWKVGDIAAQRWMRHLYKARFDEKLTVAEAVRAASLRMLKEQRARGQSTSPSIWGAFIATGAWR